jgi:hypothetical protein
MLRRFCLLFVVAALLPVSWVSTATAQAWRDCVPKSGAPGGCDSAGPGGGKAIGAGGTPAISGPGGGLSIGPGVGQPIGPSGGQSVAPGGGQAPAPSTVRPAATPGQPLR